MVAKINADVTNGVVITSDTSGELELQANGVTKAKVTSSGLIDSSGNAYGLSKTNGMYRNLIINGDMRVNQRGGTVNQTTSNPYSLDRWKGFGAVNDTFNMQQSSDAPADFSNSLLVTVLSTQASGWYSLEQVVEGYNIEHLNWGTANAKTVTLSFWVKSSLTGTFSGAFRTPTAFYSYAFDYTISSANTWEKKTVTIAAPTVGAFGTGNSAGFNIFFALSTGSITAGSWQSVNTNGSSSGNQFVNNAGATFYITGVQLEVGEGASDFEFLPYDVQLQRCFRYFEKSDGVVNGSSGGTIIGRCNWVFKVKKRATPTITEGGGSAKSGVEVTSTDLYGINRTDGNQPVIGSGSTADSEL